MNKKHIIYAGLLGLDLLILEQNNKGVGGGKTTRILFNALKMVMNGGNARIIGKDLESAKLLTEQLRNWVTRCGGDVLLVEDGIAFQQHNGGMKLPTRTDLNDFYDHTVFDKDGF